MAGWVLELKPGEPVCARFEVPDSGSGMGLTEAPRGSLGHWIEIEDGVIANYQAVVPTTWNGSPRDAFGQGGAMEEALLEHRVYDREQPLELLRTIHTFDPCIACAVHVTDPDGEELMQVKVN